MKYLELYTTFFESVKVGELYLSQNKISREELDNLIRIDPTTNKKYVGWLSKVFINEHPNIDDLRNKIEEYDTFINRGKAKTRDINQFKSFSDLKKEVDYINNSGSSISVSELQNDYEVILDNDDFYIAVPHTHESSRKLGLTKFAFRDCEGGGKDSAWCTTYKTSEHFNNYYYNYNVTFYYIRVKSIGMMNKLKNVFKKRYKVMEVVALAVLKDGRIDGYDALDRQMNKDDIKKYINILKTDDITKSFFPLVTRRNPEDRKKNHKIAINKMIEKYIKGGFIGDLIINNTPKGYELPPELIMVRGDLELSGSSITSLPKGLEVKGNLYLEDSELTKLPQNLKVKGIELSEKLTSIGDGVSIEFGDIDLEYAYKVKSLPKNLTIGGSLYLNEDIKKLPEGLYVKKDLHVLDAPIKTLPQDIKIGGVLILSVDDDYDAAKIDINKIPKGGDRRLSTIRKKYNN